MKGRTPASSVDLKGSTTSGNLIRIGIDNNRNDLNDQEFSFGNRIGHCPSMPKTFIPPEHHKRPISLSEIIRSFGESYFEPACHKTLYHHLNKDGKSTRQIRSEFREMISLGTSIITHYYDVMTGEIGFHNSVGHFVRISYEKMASMLNVSLLRIKRFFSFMKDRNFITVIEDKKKDDTGHWKSNISRKIVNPSFFINTLGISAWKKIIKFKEWIKNKAKPKCKKAKENVTMVKHLISSIGQGIVKKIPFQRFGNPDKEKDLVSKAMDRYDKDPSKSLSEHLKELKSHS